MKIVIDIPEEQFITLNAKTQKEVISVIDHKLLISAIQNGTPLPKGHGDLIDRDKLEKDTEWDEYADGFISYSHRQIFSEPAVIPADKGE